MIIEEVFSMNVTLEIGDERCGRGGGGKVLI
jgi:hypothetical protein